VGSGSGTEGCNIMLVGTPRETVSARKALHARTWAKMARKARSFWLSSDSHGSKSSGTRSNECNQHVRFTPESG